MGKRCLARVLAASLHLLGRGSGAWRTWKTRGYTACRRNFPPSRSPQEEARPAALAGQSGYGLISVGSSPKLVKKFIEAGGKNRPRYAQLHVCWAKSKEEGKAIARQQWPISALPGSLFNLPLSPPSPRSPTIQAASAASRSDSRFRPRLISCFSA